MTSKACRNFAVKIHRAKASIVFVSISTLREESKNAVDVIGGTFREMTGQKTKILDNFCKNNYKIKHQKTASN